MHRGHPVSFQAGCQFLHPLSPQGTLQKLNYILAWEVSFYSRFHQGRQPDTEQVQDTGWRKDPDCAAPYESRYRVWPGYGSGLNGWRQTMQDNRVPHNRELVSCMS